MEVKRSARDSAIAEEECFKCSVEMPLESDFLFINILSATSTSSFEKSTEERWDPVKEDWIDDSKESRGIEECVFNFKANTFAISSRLTPSTMGTAAWDLDDLDDLCNSFMSDQKLSLVFWEKEQANFFCIAYTAVCA